MFTFDPIKQRINLQKHGIDLAEVSVIFDAPMLTWENNREAYGETRLISFGAVGPDVVVLVWTERTSGAHFISCRKALKHEKREYLEAIQ